MAAEVRRDYVWNTVGVLLQNALAPVLLVLVTRLDGPQASGDLSYALGVAFVLFALGMWGGRTFQVSDTRREYLAQSFVTLRLLLGAVMLLAAAGFALVNGYDPRKTGLILALVLFRLTESVADAVHGVLQVHDRLFLAGASLTVRALTAAAVFMLLDRWTGDLVLASLGMAAVSAVVLAGFDLVQAARLEPALLSRATWSRSAREAVRVLRRTLPVFAGMFLAVFSLNIPRYFVDRHHPAQNAHFGILALGPTVVLLAMTFLLQPQIVSLARRHAAGEGDGFRRTISRLGGLVLLTGGAATLLAAAAGAPLLHAVFGMDFAPYRLEIVLVVLGGVASAVVSVALNVLTIMRRFTGQVVVMAGSTALLAALAAGLVPSGGLRAAVVSFLAVSCLQAAALYAVYAVALRGRRS